MTVVHYSDRVAECTHTRTIRQDRSGRAAIRSVYMADRLHHPGQSITTCPSHSYQLSPHGRARQVGQHDSDRSKQRASMGSISASVSTCSHVWSAFGASLANVVVECLNRAGGPPDEEIGVILSPRKGTLTARASACRLVCLDLRIAPFGCSCTGCMLRSSTLVLLAY